MWQIGQRLKYLVMENLHTLLLQLNYSFAHWSKMRYPAGYDADANKDVDYSMLMSVQWMKSMTIF